MKTPALFGMVPVSLSPTGAGTPNTLLVTIKASNDSAGAGEIQQSNNWRRCENNLGWVGTHTYARRTTLRKSHTYLEHPGRRKPNRYGNPKVQQVQILPASLDQRTQHEN